MLGRVHYTLFINDGTDKDDLRNDDIHDVGREGYGCSR